MGRLLALDRSMEPTLAPLLSLMDVPVEDAEWQGLDPPERRRRTLEAVKHLLLRESLLQPLLVVFEDLHWVDTETQAFLDGLVDSVPKAQPAAPRDISARAPARVGQQDVLLAAPAGSAARGERRRAAHGAARSDAQLEPVASLLIARTQGNPFFLEESLRALVETGVLSGERGAYRLTGAVGTVAVPVTVQAVLAARIDRLPPADKALLQTASVIGKDVPFALLREIADGDEYALRRALSELQAAEFLYEARLFPDLEYTFKHALTHEVAYASLLQERRRALHGRLVEAIERLHAGRLAEQVDTLAHHAFRGCAWPKALSYLRQAGVRALDRSANREAAAYFEQAITAVEHLPRDAETIRTSIDLRVDLRTALYPLGEEEDRISEHLRVGERLASELGDDLLRSRIVAFQAHLAWSASDPMRAMALSEHALALAEGGADLGLRVLAGFFLGQACHSHGDYRRGVTVLTDTLDGCPPRWSESDSVWDFPPPWWYAYGSRSVSPTWGASPTRGRGPRRQGRSPGRWRARLYSDYHVRVAVGVVAARQGDLDAAIPSLEGAVELARHGNLQLMVTSGLGWLAEGYLPAGRASEAAAALEESLSHQAEIRFGAFHHHSLALLAEARLRTGDIGEAERQAARR